jgi:hypothetical protein
LRRPSGARILGICLVCLSVVDFIFFVPLVPASFNVCPPVHSCPVMLAEASQTTSLSFYLFQVGGISLGGSGFDPSYLVVLNPMWVCHQSPDGSGCGLNDALLFPFGSPTDPLQSLLALGALLILPVLGVWLLLLRRHNRMKNLGSQARG